MISLQFLLCTCAILASVVSIRQRNVQCSSNYKVIYGWKELDFDFVSPERREELIENGEYIPANNIISSIKVGDCRIFLTVPRRKEGVPATLVYVSKYEKNPQRIKADTVNGPLLKPYPSWEMNEIGNCSALQYVHSMEIDQYNRMWIIDSGRIHSLTNPVYTCPPKIVMIDLNSDTQLHSYVFPNEVVPTRNTLLNDLVVGCISEDVCWAYITDSKDSRIVIYDYAKNSAWYVKHQSMDLDESAVNFRISGTDYNIRVNVDGIALSPLDSNYDRVYYTPLSSYNLHSVAASVLQMAKNGMTLWDADITDHGKMSSQTDGMTMDSNGILYKALLQNNSISHWDTISNTNISKSNEIVLVKDDIDLQYPNSFSLDKKGFLYAATLKLHRYYTNTYNFSDINFKVIRVNVGTKSYMFSAKDNLAKGCGCRF